MPDDIYVEFELNAQEALDALRRNLGKVRTGRASVSLLDGIMVKYYGVATPLSQVATLSVPDARTLAIQPWDKGVITEVEKAIMQSDLGLTPQNQGGVIRIHLPDLTEERRKELVKVVKKREEESKVSIRSARHEANNALKEKEKGGDISEDEYHKALKRVQELTDTHIAASEDIVKAKEKEVMEF